MRKNAVLATAALLLAGSIASAEVKTSITVLQGWDVVGYRQSGADDEDRAFVATDAALRGAKGPYAAEYDGLTWFGRPTDKNRYSGVSVKTDTFGVDASFKTNWNAFSMNGYSGWAKWGGLYVGFAGNGLGRFSDITDHVYGISGFFPDGDSFFQWKVLNEGKAVKKDHDDYKYNTYNILNLGVPLENRDGGHQLGIKYTYKNLTLAAVTCNDLASRITDDETKTDIKKANALYGLSAPTDLNFQANYDFGIAKTSLTFKMRTVSETAENLVQGSATNGLNIASDPLNIAFALAASSDKLVKNLRLGMCYTVTGFNAVNANEYEVKTDSNRNGLFGEAGESALFDNEYWGQALNLGASYKLTKKDTITVASTTTMINMSDYMKAVSNLNKYGWAPFISEDALVTYQHQFNDRMTGEVQFEFVDYNLNSDTGGKAEAEFILFPSATFKPTKGANVNVGLKMKVENLSSDPVGKWGTEKNETISYVYPKTFSVTIPVTLTISF